MHRPIAALWVVAPLVVAAGCAARVPMTYRLQQHLLVPPGVAGPSVAARTISTDVPLLDRRRCADPAGAVQVQRRGSHARVTVARDALTGGKPGSLAAWTVELESQGCLAPGEGLNLAARIVEAVPLAPSAAFRLLHPVYRPPLFADIGPESRLQVYSPILRDGAAADAPVIESAKISGAAGEVEIKASSSLLGYETAWYAVRPKPRGTGFAIEPLYAESHIQGSVDRSDNPRVNHFHFNPEAAFYRMFYRGEHTIIVVSAPTRGELDRETKALAEDPGACAKFPAGACVLLPESVGMNAFIVAVVNGHELPLPAGSTVGGALRQAGANPRGVLASLAVRKPYGGKPVAVEFDPASTDVLDLTLLGGEEIFWH